MSTYEEALARAQDMIDAAYNNALTYEGASKYGMARANALAGLVKAQIDLAEHLKAIEPEPDETPPEASLGLLLRVLENGWLTQQIAAIIADSPAKSKVGEIAEIVTNVVRGIVQRATPPDPEGKYFPSYRDATYKTADYPPKETVGPKCNVINDNGVMCQYPYHHDDWLNPHSHSWEL